MTFGAGSNNYLGAVKRLTSQANNLELFDKVIGYTDSDLKKDNEFWNKHSEFILSNKRGYGYWIWKPYLIMKTLETMNDNDILVYADAGCEIDVKKKLKWNNIFNKVQSNLIIGTLTGHDEHKYNKKDLILYLNMNDDKYLNTNQRQASALCILKCKKNVDLIKEWYDISCNYHFIDDSPSIELNHNSFKAHRHDQSIYSLLIKKNNIYSDNNLESVIDIKRNRSGKSKL
jgi:hypothetical protein